MTGYRKLGATLVSALALLSAMHLSAQEAASTAGETRYVTTTPLASRAPADMPPNPPKVTCNGGQLTISALNSTLGAVLNAVHNCVGAEIDVPEAARGERLFAELGPGPVRAVLADFLSSTDFNYVIKASTSDPQKVQTVLLNPRSNEPVTEIATVSSSTSNLSANRRAWMDARHNYEQSVAPPEDVATQQEEAVSSAPAPVESGVTSVPAQVETGVASANSAPASTNPVSAEAEPVNSAPVAAVDPSPVAAPSSTPSGAATVPGASSAPQSQGKSTQEMIGDMKRLFEQRKQMVQQQQPATAR